jgi:hypothetical protein
MAEQNPYKPGTKEWQDWINAQVAAHDAEVEEDQGSGITVVDDEDD